MEEGREGGLTRTVDVCEKVLFCLNKTIRETVEHNYIHVSHYFFVTISNNSRGARKVIYGRVKQKQSLIV